jgi:hypothetical protein
MRTVCTIKVGHFADVRIPDYPAKSCVTRLSHLDYAAALVFPQHGATFRRTQLAYHAACLLNNNLRYDKPDFRLVRLSL